MSWLPGDIRQELLAMGNLLRARPGVHELESKLCEALKRKLGNMSGLTSSELVACYEALQAANLPDKLNTELLKAFDDLAIQCDQPQSKVLASSGQECKTFYKYLTSTDLDELEKSSMWEGCHVLAKRMKALGICGMKESLKKCALGILVWHENQRSKKMPCAELVYSLARHLFDCLQSAPVQVPDKSLCLASYPEDPCHLETQHFQAAYPSDKPVKKDFPQLAVIIQKHCWVRNTAAALSAKEA